MKSDVSLNQESGKLSGLRRLRGWRRAGFPLVAILLGLAPFIVLECVLAVFDVGTVNRPEDPFVGFSSVQPLFELDEEDDVYRTARSRQMFFGPQQFARRKPRGTFRIFGLGGSTVRGRPYETDTSLVKWLEIELNECDSGRHYETVNCGGLSYASYRLTLILDEVLQYEPDLMIIATGHNEFLEDRTYDSVKNRSPLTTWGMEKLFSLRIVNLASRFFRGPGPGTDADDDGTLLEAEVNARLDSGSGYASYHRDDRWWSGVIEHFEFSVRRMVDTCRGARVPLVLVNLGENLRDCPPFKSQHESELSAGPLQRWQELFDRASDFEDSNPDDALQMYREAESIDDQYALLIYRMARCFDRLGDMEQARRYYARAKDLDICPLRMLDEMHQRLKRIAEDTGTPLVDAQQLLVQLSPHGIPGNNCFMDHVHPNIGSHQRIAGALALKLEEISLVTRDRDWEDTRRRLAYRRHFDQISPAYLANGRRRVGWVENWARRNRLQTEMLPKDARGHLHLGQKRLDYGQSDSAWEQFQLATRKDPRLVRDVLDHALELVKQGRGNLPEEILLRLRNEPAAAQLRPLTELARLILALDAGRSLEAEVIYSRHRGAIDEAAKSAAGWLDIVPDALEQVKTGTPHNRPQLGSEAPADLPHHGAVHQGDQTDKAEPGEEEPPASETQPVDTPDVASQQQAAEAEATAKLIRLLSEAIRRNPDKAPLYLARARLHFKRRDLDAALGDSTEAVRLDPDSPDAYRIRALVHTIQGDLEQAVSDLTKVIRIDPGDPDVFRARGNAYQVLGEDTKAEADFRAARKLSAGD